jgi:hypothetical protein
MTRIFTLDIMKPKDKKNNSKEFIRIKEIEAVEKINDLTNLLSEKGKLLKEIKLVEKSDNSYLIHYIPLPSLGNLEYITSFSFQNLMKLTDLEDFFKKYAFDICIAYRFYDYKEYEGYEPGGILGGSSYRGYCSIAATFVNCFNKMPDNKII